MSGSVCNCVAVETVVANSLCENTNVSHTPDDASRSFIKRIKRESVVLIYVFDR